MTLNLPKRGASHEDGVGNSDQPHASVGALPLCPSPPFRSKCRRHNYEGNIEEYEGRSLSKKSSKQSEVRVVKSGTGLRII